MQNEIIASLQKEVEINLEKQIKRVFRDAIENNGAFAIEADYHSHTSINELVEKIGLEVCGMHIRQTEFIIEFEFGEKYLTIPNFPLRECRICLQNDGEYYLALDSDSLSSSWWFAMTDIMHNFNNLSDVIAEQILNDMNKVIEFNYLTI
jgi:hypothetical protein